ncbi:hypothetical protein K493DRAFT_370600 [Basidiobolus meristosporus CBS 931.73]|uniref:Galactosyl transferase GMA12/MNN10 family protein n=1 Tax=Basidiobolus meristosporus CBS 931.73 TaxID=1314790 RepID=A0A1Y1YGD2_9FUNG|nr:hypothetical protein K493DRAFT_370600 [Basidiobolus meristosporus CBS 931.73]|eukprot:ORX96694.1 hypothetical protein K493DRAFT_370600 [Basidiobolus meristosporus CBS 931.73]
MTRKVRVILITIFVIALCLFFGFSYLNTLDGAGQWNLSLDALDHSSQTPNGYPAVTPQGSDDYYDGLPGDDEATAALPKYDLVVLIASEMNYFANRKLLRKELFGMTNNLKPCLKANGRIHYKFFVTESDLSNEDQRQFRSELMEYDDIITLPKSSPRKKEYAMLRWVSTSRDTEESFDFRHVMLLDSHSYVRFDQILSELDYMAQEATDPEKLSVLWGNLELEGDQTRAVVLGAHLVEELLTSPSLLPPPTWRSSIVPYLLSRRTDKEVAHISMINDKRFIEWPNSASLVPKSTIAVSMIYQLDEFVQLTARLPSNQPPLCVDTRQEGKIGVITSSYIYKDGCMMDAGLLSAINKRNYAAKHGYYFVARSDEFAQQVYRGRRIVWGKIDAIEKILPEYDWLFWLDMDAVVMNEEIRLEDILERFRQELGDEEFAKKSLFITKPRRDPMFNAGVFLLKNSPWAFDFLRAVQHRQENYNTVYYEQKAMWEVTRNPKWADGAHIFGDSSVFNTFPNSYVPGNFVVHFAPAGCPAGEVMAAIQSKNITSHA